MDNKTLKFSAGQKFMADLNAATDKESMLVLACNVIQKSHTKRTFLERKLPENETALKMRATFAMMNVATKKDLSTDDMLVLIKKHYNCDMKFGDFDKDFRNAYPREYGVKEQKINPQIMMAARNRSSLGI